MDINSAAHRLCDFITKHGGVVTLNNSAFAEFCRMVLDIWDKGRKDNKAEVKWLRAVKSTASRVVEQTNATAAYRLHDALIRAIEAADAAKGKGP